ncbi:MAG: hypothetical protein J5590_03070 [Clostridia bacterium]|nr:hypothetical protein [Clostridia bacterium]
MSAYTYGTSALKIEKTEPRKKVKRGTAKKVSKKYVRSNMLGILVVTSLAFLLLARYAIITEKTTRLTKLRAEYETANSMVVQKEFDLEREVDLQKIEEIATTKLGMQRPEKNQMVYITMDNSDYTEKAESVDASRGGFFASVTGGLNNIVEYFR